MASSQPEPSVPARLFDNTMTLEWIVLVEDYPNVAQKRNETRPLHIKHVLPRTDPENGVYSMGGITLLEAPKMGEPIKIGGVASVIKAPSAEAALEEVKQDPYYVNGIWDPSTIRIIPFICAVRNPGGYHGK